MTNRPPVYIIPPLRGTGKTYKPMAKPTKIDQIKALKERLEENIKYRSSMLNNRPNDDLYAMECRIMTRSDKNLINLLEIILEPADPIEIKLPYIPDPLPPQTVSITLTPSKNQKNDQSSTK